MPDALPSPLAQVIVRLADNKYLLGRRFSEWTNRAPALEAAVAAAAMTQDELGHARSLYAALQNLPDSPEAYLNEEKRKHLLGLPRLGASFQHWAEFVAAVALFDRALTLVFEAARDSRYEPLRQRASKILQEEWFHRQYGEGWLKRLAGEPKTRPAMQTAVSQWWTPSSEWLFTNTGHDPLMSAEVLGPNAAAVLQRWTAESQALLTGCGLVSNG